MTTSIRISASSLGSPYMSPKDLGTLSPGDQSSTVDTYISHSSSTDLTNCAIYLTPYAAGTYLGAASASDDFDTIIGWGDDFQPATSGGGLYVNMNHTGGFPSSDWDVFYTGHGDSSANMITISSSAISTGSGADGVIPAAGEVHLKWRLDIPATYTGTGIGYVDTVLYYVETS